MIEIDKEFYLADYVEVSKETPIPKYRNVKGIVVKTYDNCSEIMYDDCLVRDFLPRIANIPNEYLTKIGKVKSLDLNIIYDVNID